MSTLVVNMSGRELTEQERTDLSDQFHSDDADYIFHDVDHYDRYRHERGISPLHRIVETYLAEAVAQGDITYEDQLILIIPVDTTLYDLHQTYNSLLHSWLVKAPRLIFSYAWLTAGETIPAQFTHQEVSLRPVVSPDKREELAAQALQRRGLSLVDINEKYLPSRNIVGDLRQDQDGIFIHVKKKEA